MSKEKQIEEMARDLENHTCMSQFQAEIASRMLYNVGYRKQSEGTWEKSDIPGEKYVCSECGGACWYYDFEGDVAKSKFCPNCGAKMKGV